MILYITLVVYIFTAVGYGMTAAEDKESFEECVAIAILWPLIFIKMLGKVFWAITTNRDYPL